MRSAQDGRCFTLFTVKRRIEAIEIAKRIFKSSVLPRSQVVKRRPIETGIVDWNTMAPEIFARARVSFPLMVQVIELNFSGSSVATGAMRSERINVDTPDLIENSVIYSMNI